MSYRIGSFNLRNLGFSALSSKNERDLHKIAEIIKNERFDVVALQEILSEGKAFTYQDAIKRSILMELGNNWDFQWANAETQLADTRNEGYAFLWDKRRLRMPTTSTVDGNMRVFYPRICRLSREDTMRRPFYARFTPSGTLAGGPWIEYRLLCIHTYYGTDSSADRNIRQRELDVLMKDIYPQVADRRYGEYGNGMPAYTIILGDYNVELRRQWKDIARAEQNTIRKAQGKSPYPKPASLCADENDCVETTKWGYRRIKTVQDQFTTLRGADNDVEDDKNSELNGYAHDYDHFSFEESRFEGINMEVRRVDAVRKYCNGNFSTYRDTISDHIPIMMEIELR